ncbi:hypothetical protein CIRG_08378 [Coccidioides immitis RMSCC 2394]|uniref:Uncharacterized protein n=1 Tax=Coccidioides immitis RMSCC 2394 TaxID=404692 RepID=A0A0J7BEW9_COCIT|nr:hypothetical protein CIRG_08378 [Coccidioides immitis RMSCC 2394]
MGRSSDLSRVRTYESMGRSLNKPLNTGNLPRSEAAYPGGAGALGKHGEYVFATKVLSLKPMRDTEGELLPARHSVPSMSADYEDGSMGCIVHRVDRCSARPCPWGNFF